MNKILVLSNYPTGALLKDGMFQRVKAIDGELSEFQRVYLSVSLNKNWIGTHKKIDESVELYKLNIAVHFLFIIYLFCKSHTIYIHSVYNFYLLSFLPFQKKDATFDLHGTAPEETLFMGYPIWAKIYGKGEKIAFDKCSNFIYVSEEMKDYYIRKYPIAQSKKHFVKPIFPSNAFVSVSEDCVKNRKEKLGIKNEDVVFIYSGNLQKWQNVELMMDRISQVNDSHMFFIFLTGDIEGMKKMADAKFADNNIRYVIESVTPEELGEYYAVANYGFILRDEHILNQVASPTKLTEYLFYGLTPIVKFEKLGDAYRYGYDFVRYDADLSKLERIKSEKNREIAKMMLNKNRKESVCSIMKI